MEEELDRALEGRRKRVVGYQSIGYHKEVALVKCILQVVELVVSY